MSTRPIGGPLSAEPRCFALKYTKYFCAKSPCPAKKSLAAGHIANFQTAPSGLWDKILEHLVKKTRTNAGRKESPTKLCRRSSCAASDAFQMERPVRTKVAIISRITNRRTAFPRFRMTYRNALLKMLMVDTSILLCCSSERTRRIAPHSFQPSDAVYRDIYHSHAVLYGSSSAGSKVPSLLKPHRQGYHFLRQRMNR